jgi:hypothetical protein
MECLQSNELERMWKQLVVTKHLPGGTEKNVKSNSQERRSLNRYLISGLMNTKQKCDLYPLDYNVQMT